MIMAERPLLRTASRCVLHGHLALWTVSLLGGSQSCLMQNALILSGMLFALPLIFIHLEWMPPKELSNPKAMMAIP